jgi:hypothetical protein
MVAGTSDLSYLGSINTRFAIQTDSGKTLDLIQKVTMAKKGWGHDSSSRAQQVQVLSSNPSTSPSQKKKKEN